MIGTRIRYYRKRSGYTLEQLAEGICSVSYLSKFEHGEKASDEIVQLLCNRLGISYKDVDNKEELDQINRLLDEWYEEIKDRNAVKVHEREERTSQDLATNIEDPLIILKYDLFQFRMYLFDEENEKGEILLQSIDNLKKFLLKNWNTIIIISKVYIISL